MGWQRWAPNDLSTTLLVNDPQYAVARAKSVKDVRRVENTHDVRLG